MGRKGRNALVVALVACVSLLAPAGASASGPWDYLLAPEPACPGQSDPSLARPAQVKTMVCMHRYARARLGLPRLDVSKHLRYSATRKARDIERCQQFSHNACGRNAFYWFRRVRYFRGSFGAGENLALGNGGAATVRATMSSWLNSDEHRSVLLTRSFNQLGIGLVSGGFQGYSGVAIWVAHFGYHHG